MNCNADLWPEICSFENLYESWRLALRHKRCALSAARFSFNAEAELFALRDQLLSNTYKPGDYRIFTIREPKERIIAAAPFIDRVVHHALVRVIEPVFERRFICDSYATRVGKGTHAAMLRFYQFYRQYDYVLKCDVKKFFPSIDHQILKNMLASDIHCSKTLALVNLIIDHSPSSTGLPIGNLTSQLFANIYLDRLDHFIKEKLRVKGYVRYMDDFCLFGNDKLKLKTYQADCAEFLAGLRLAYRYPKTRLFSTTEGVEFLGYRIFRTHRRIVTATARRMEKNLALKYAAVLNRILEPSFFRQSLASCLGHLQWAAARGLEKKMAERGNWGI